MTCAVMTCDSVGCNICIHNQKNYFKPLPLIVSMLYLLYMGVSASLAVYAGQQVRILGENYSLDDEEDSRTGQVSLKHTQRYMCIPVFNPSHKMHHLPVVPYS